ncbi:MAG: peptidase domain-containing ABC transporter [Gammaproteobacteria bacterium]|nr:peptidase domain-containing ABC transporter [Gammaproteobacteria bacterium]
MKEIAKLLNFSFGKKLPMMLQTEVAECGLACLAMIASYYGYETDLLTLRRQYSISLKGSRLQDLIDLGRKFHLLSRAVKLELQDLKHLKTPCILHWDLDHFVVLKKVSGNNVTIHDPAVGVIKYKMSEVSKHFTGVAMELTPAKDFSKKKDKTKLSLSDLWHSVQGIKKPLVQIILLSLALEVFAIVSTQFMQLVTDQVIVTNDFPLLYVLAIGFALLKVIEVSTEYARTWIVLFMGSTLNIQLTSNLNHHLLKLPMDFFEKRHMGDIVSRFGSIGAIQQKISTDFIEGIIDGFMTIVTLVIMLFYSYSLSFIVFTALLLYILLRVVFYSTFKRLSQENLVIGAKENSIFMESIRAILPLKIFGKESQRENLWQNCYADKLNSGIRISKYSLIYKILNHIIFGSEAIIVIVLGATAVMNRELSLGMLFAYISYSGQFTSKAQAMVDKVVEYRLISVQLERVADIALTEPEKDIKGDMLSQKIIQGGVRVNNLAFKYSEQDPYVFKNINFEIKAGESVAIVGQSGCGKTTLMKVLLRLLAPSSGDVFIDGVDINKMSLKDYRSQIAAVMQDDVLLSGSIAENICFFDPKPDFDRIYACAMIAAIHEDIIRMPMAYQSLVGDMGSTLSGGQKQRVLLARALYSQPKILFLDEATSHLDTNNEKIINHHVKNIGITRIIVAHRKETVLIADRVIDLEEMIREQMEKEDGYITELQ